MRTIKFRGATQALRVRNGKEVTTYSRWYYGDLLEFSGVHYIIGDLAGEWHAVTPKTVGQCTGRRDKHNHEIYEGDIIRVTFSNGREIVRAVTYDELAAAFMYEKDGISNMGQCWRLEVLGDIYNNPELLEKEIEE